MVKNEKIEFSRIQSIEEIGRDGIFLKLSADEYESAALAERFDIMSITGLKAELHLRSERGGDIIAVSGMLEALVEQECVVSLEPVSSKISSKVEERFANNTEIADDIFVSMDESEAIDDLLVGNEVDLGEMLAQCLYLALDPYPRKDGVIIKEELESVAKDVGSNPFSVLEKLNAKEKF
ncbi:MAG: hypothetical protein CMP14_00890 [Rickettsiales bacterium]|jgi:uncharacterized metal-binding protein YceD (DUF177 family)|nr:hypothetical protein [Rickettsiales bacterium]|tara:strand:+ start:75 stop:614 length:540 start_codon:yes stop_codon:yes gene_type:complete